MMICYSPITTCSRNAIHIKRHLSNHLYGVVSQGSYKFRCYSLFSGLPKKNCTGFGLSISNRPSFGSVLINRSTVGRKGKLEVSFLSSEARTKCSEIESNMRNLYVYTSVVVSLLVCYSSTSQSAYAEASRDKDDHNKKKKNNVYNNNNSSDNGKFYNGKRVYTDYSIIGIPGDGRCLFRSVAHGFCLRSGKVAPSEHTQRKLADELRNRVADEFIKRREESEWFVEGDFDTYVTQIREPQVWGGEPELFMASHVLQMPITVYMKDEKAGGLLSIAEYGQEYGKEDPIRVLYHGFGHYDALLVHDRKAPLSKSKL
ncbi:unnamed protein product [Microthlaspi erraticum]|uniref:Ubiquitin thioesterase OTU n=1 Tax=Microthlaspi erraticum TaxID=1685480 RepID=A0A6D2L246_9BRAS|nr:unnamed protein product [Microthlaspi erraticum]